MIGIRPSTKRRYGNAKRRSIHKGLSKCRQMNTNGEHAVKTGKKPDNPKEVKLQDDEPNGKDYLESFDYGDIWKTVMKIGVFDGRDVRMEYSKEGGCLKVSAPGFTRDLPVLSQRIKGVGDVAWNYNNGVLEINQPK